MCGQSFSDSVKSHLSERVLVTFYDTHSLYSFNSTHQYDYWDYFLDGC